MVMVNVFAPEVKTRTFGNAAWPVVEYRRYSVSSVGAKAILPVTVSSAELAAEGSGEPAARIGAMLRLNRMSHAIILALATEFRVSAPCQVRNGDADV